MLDRVQHGRVDAEEEGFTLRQSQYYPLPIADCRMTNSISFGVWQSAIGNLHY
jgi:hypothetical protein